MLRILYRTLTMGIVTEPSENLAESEFEALGITIKKQIDKRFYGTLAIRMVDAGSCNGCELEIHALNNAYYDVERFGIHFVASPRHADVLLITGSVSRHMESALLRTWESTPAPKFIIAAGDCACNGGIFGTSYACVGSVDHILPVNARIAGCPPSPFSLLQGLRAAFGDSV